MLPGVRVMSLAVLVVLGAACRGDDGRGADLAARERAIARKEREAREADRRLDEREQELDRKLRELTARPLPERGAREPDAGPPLDARVLGRVARPFGPLAPLAPAMTRAEVLRAIPSAQRDGALGWVPTGVADVAAELSFDAADRLDTVTFHVPLAARSLFVEAWGAPAAETNTWLDRAGGWRAELGEQPTKGKIVLTLVGFTPFADVLGPGGAGDRLVGATLAELRARFGARLGPATRAGLVEVAMPGATDACGAPTELGLEVGGDGRVRRAILLQCFDGAEAQRRAVLAALEARWGPAQVVRTPDDRLVFAWTAPAGRVEAQVIHHGKKPLWEVRLGAPGAGGAGG